MSEFVKSEVLNDTKSIDTQEILDDSNSSNHDNVNDNLEKLMTKLELTQTTQDEEFDIFTEAEILAIKCVYEKLLSENFPVEKLSWPEIGT